MNLDDCLAPSDTSSEDQPSYQPTCERWDPLGAPNEEEKAQEDTTKSLDNLCDHQ